MILPPRTNTHPTGTSLAAKASSAYPKLSIPITLAKVFYEAGVYH